MRSEITYRFGLSCCFPVQCLKESCIWFSLHKPFRVLQTVPWGISSRPLWPTLAGASSDITCRSSVEWTCSSVAPIAQPNRGAEPLILSLVVPSVIRKTWVPQRPLQPGPWTAMSSAIRKPACNYISNQLLLLQYYSLSLICQTDIRGHEAPHHHQVLGCRLTYQGQTVTNA